MLAVLPSPQPAVRAHGFTNSSEAPADPERTGLPAKAETAVSSEAATKIFFIIDKS
jgi:hypothetical protein